MIHLDTKATHGSPWGAALVAVLAVFVASGGASESRAQGFTSTIPDFAGTWDRTNDDQHPGSFSCGGILDTYGNPKTGCKIPFDRVIDGDYLNERGRAWLRFLDEPLSPKWDCASASMPTVFGDGYLWTLTRREDAILIQYEMGNWVRWVWMDGRKHPPASDLYYNGHSIGRYEGDELVVETTNFTFDPDGMDDHLHMATSVRKKMTERYRFLSEDVLEMTVTIDDSLFLNEPFTWSHVYRRTDEPHVSTFECSVEQGRQHLYAVIPEDYTPQTDQPALGVGR